MKVKVLISTAIVLVSLVNASFAKENHVKISKPSLENSLILQKAQLIQESILNDVLKLDAFTKAVLEKENYARMESLKNSIIRDLSITDSPEGFDLQKRFDVQSVPIGDEYFLKLKNQELLITENKIF